MKTSLYIVLTILLFASCKNQPTPRGGVIATNAWTAAFAIAAGVTDISVLAPYEMVHPSEYELRPGDIGRLSNADLIIYAGYEVMVNQIKTGLSIPEEKLVLIATSYNLEDIESSVMLIAEKTGTETLARKNIEEIRQLFAQARSRVQELGLDKELALVHYFQKSFAEESGINAFSIFGPAPPEPKQILSLTNSNASLILDNAHNPVGGPLRETMKNADYKMLLNFPGLYETRTIADVITYNINQLIGE
jgi:hypothetical protein